MSEPETFEVLLHAGKSLASGLFAGWTEPPSMHESMLILGQVMLLVREDGPLAPVLKLAGESARYRASFTILGGDGVAVPQTEAFLEAERNLARKYLIEDGCTPELTEACLALSEP